MVSRKIIAIAQRSWFALQIPLFGWMVPALLGEQAVLIYKDGTLDRQSVRQYLSFERHEDLHHAWVWADHSAPRRLEADALGRDLTLEDSSRPLTVKILCVNENCPANLRLVAAPVDMWTDVPEGFLPNWPVPDGGELKIPYDATRAWRLRAVGNGFGTWWLDVPPGRHSAVMQVNVAEEGHLRIQDQTGSPLPQARLNLLSNALSRGERPLVLAKYIAGDEGEVHIPGLPDADAFTLYAFTGRHAPTVLAARISTLPESIGLHAGGTIRGQFSDERGVPLPGVVARAEAWVSGRLPASVVQSTEADHEGRWILESLPLGKVAVIAMRRDLAPVRRLVELEADGIDLGQIVLQHGISVPVQVVDDANQPIVGAQLFSDPAIMATTDSEGRAQLGPLSGSSSLRVSVQADGYLPRETTFAQVGREELRISLHSAFRVVGRLVDQQHMPLSEGLIRIHVGSIYRQLELSSSSRFEIDLEPGTPATLSLRSSTTDELRIRVEPGAPGEKRDLGDVVLEDGIQVRGQLVRADGRLVNGARIWSPRPSEQGEVVAWAHRDLIETVSTIAGEFELSGLPQRSALLRIDAPGLARAHVLIDPEPGRTLIDVGTIVLNEGVSVTIWGDESAEGAVARIDLRNLWLQSDMLTGTIQNGRAIFPHVPPGPVTVTVLQHDELLCEDSIDLALEDAHVDFECRRSTLQVTGTVLIGGRPSGPGALLWLPYDSGSVPSVVLNFQTRSGLHQQQAFGVGRPDVRVEVDATGWFATDKLRPGSWNVAWLPTRGRSLADPQRVDLPAADSYELGIVFSKLAVSGVVLNRDAQPVENARVRDLTSGAESFTGPDGRFVLSGLAPGPHQLFARSLSETSDIVDITVEPQDDPEDVQLVIEERRDRLEIQVLDSDGVPVSQAFTFLESERQSLQILTTDRDGRSSIQLLPLYPKRLRAAVLHDGRWSLGEWRDLEGLSGSWTLFMTEGVGIVRIVSEKPGSPDILSATGWNVSRMFGWAGLRLTVSPDQPLVIRGLPAGPYSISLGETVSHFVVDVGDLTEIEIR